MPIILQENKMSKNNKTPNEELEAIVTQGENELLPYIEGRGDLPVSDGDKKPAPKDPAPAPTSHDDGSSTPDYGTTPAPTPTSSVAPAPEKGPANIEIGVSHAYGGVPETDIYGKQNKPEKTPREPIKKPERAKNSKGGGGNNIMELFWNEIILKTYGWCVDFCVDTVLDLADFVLFPEGDGEESKKEKLNIFVLGQKIRDASKTKMQKRKEVCLKGYKEFLNNLVKDSKGEKITWSIQKSEPPFFKDISKIYQKKDEDRTEDEKQLVHMINNPPLEQMINDGMKMHDMALAAATCEVAADRENGYIVSKTFKENMEHLKKHVSTGNMTSSLEAIANILKEIECYGESVAPIIQGLSSLKETVLAKDTKAGKKEYQNIVSALDELKENPAFWEARILSAEKQYFAQIEKGVAVILSEDQHTVSKTFSKQMMLLNRIISNGHLTSNETKNTSIELLKKMASSLSDTNEIQRPLKQKLNEILQEVKADTTGSISDSIKKHLDILNEIHTDNNPKTIARKQYLTTIADNIVATKKACDKCSGVVASVVYGKRLAKLNKAVNNMKGAFASITATPRASTNLNLFDVYNTIIQNSEK
jgi:polyhydroxyalkanoate synthesis regulator phasin